ncbi:BREX system ATP-binding domain-containing protein [Streptomyces sp. B93]|uniref:BREX system ATP-binding domain-containing protein n=1 Tax=Streptomyces sp. B93 TaxID=2824875 RepID=UPI001B392E27|nr:BREX system ATP-binding domain-containing protein [Streptomyces sp. B93]MBQ1091709.1 DUF2791 family P-loop domain-containing protein [Streptomyces sp. B93]
MARAVTGALGGRSGIAPRLYLRKLVAEVLDHVDEYEDFAPRSHYSLTLRTVELRDTEPNAASGTATAPASNAADVHLDLT